MFKLCLMLLCLVPLASFAERLQSAESEQRERWTYVAGNDSRSRYIDISTIKRKKDIVGVWALDDYAKKQNPLGISYMSAVAYYEFDCKDRKVRILQSIFYSGNMGLGEQVYSYAESTPGNWDYITPQRLCNVVRAKVCERKP